MYLFLKGLNDCKTTSFLFYVIVIALTYQLVLFLIKAISLTGCCRFHITKISFCPFKKIRLSLSRSFIFPSLPSFIIQHHLQRFSRNMSYKYIIIKIAFLNTSIWKDHFSISMLYTSNPFTNISTSFRPNHFTMSIPFIIFITSFI